MCYNQGCLVCIEQQFRKPIALTRVQVSTSFSIRQHGKISKELHSYLRTENLLPCVACLKPSLHELKAVLWPEVPTVNIDLHQAQICLVCIFFCLCLACSPLASKADLRRDVGAGWPPSILAGAQAKARQRVQALQSSERISFFFLRTFALVGFYPDGWVADLAHLCDLTPTVLAA